MYACRYFLQRYYEIFTLDLQSWSSFTVFLPWFTWSKKDRSGNKLKDQLVQCSHLPDKETEPQTTVNLVTYNKHHLSNPCICGLAAFVLWLLSSAGFTHGSVVSCQGGWERANLRSFTWRLISDPHGLPSRSGWVCGWAPKEQEEVWTASWSPHLKPVQLGFSHSVGPNKWQNQLRFQEWRSGSTWFWLEEDARNYGFCLFFKSTWQTVLWLAVLFLLWSNFGISLAIKNTRN